MIAIPEIAALLKLARQPGTEGIPAVKAALLADTASQLLAGALKGYVRHLGLHLDLFEGEFDQIEMAVLDPTSALHAFRPETVIVYLAAERMAGKFGTLSVAERSGFAEEFRERARRLHEALSARGYQTLFFNLADPGDGVFGNYGSKVAWSLQNQIRQCNLELMRLAQEASDFHVYDLAALQAAMGRAALFDPKLYFVQVCANPGHSAAGGPGRRPDAGRAEGHVPQVRHLGLGQHALGWSGRRRRVGPHPDRRAGPGTGLHRFSIVAQTVARPGHCAQWADRNPR